MSTAFFIPTEKCWSLLFSSTLSASWLRCIGYLLITEKLTFLFENVKGLFKQRNLLIFCWIKTEIFDYVFTGGAKEAKRYCTFVKGIIWTLLFFRYRFFCSWSFKFKGINYFFLYLCNVIFRHLLPFLLRFSRPFSGLMSF